MRVRDTRKMTMTSADRGSDVVGSLLRDDDSLLLRSYYYFDFLVI
jgi:hypothetical protein